MFGIGGGLITAGNVIAETGAGVPSGMGVTFHHPAVKGDLMLRLPPKQVEWTYNMNTTTTPTYGGEVVQILSVNFEKFAIAGQFGKEGPWGLTAKNKRRQNSSWTTKSRHGIGLWQMTEWFKAYFSISSQGVGRDETPDTNYREEPVTIRYAGNIDTLVDLGKDDNIWKVYPVNFPSYRRSNENFAPEWRVECEVAEAPGGVSTHEKMAAVTRLKFGDRYTPLNPFSDPTGFFTDKKKKAVLDRLHADAIAQARQDATDIADYYNTLLGTLATTEINELLSQGASLPNSIARKSQKAGKKVGRDRIKESSSRRHLKSDPFLGF